MSPRRPDLVNADDLIALALALEVGCPAIECHDEIEEVPPDGVM